MSSMNRIVMVLSDTENFKETENGSFSNHEYTIFTPKSNHWLIDSGKKMNLKSLTKGYRQ